MSGSTVRPVRVLHVIESFGGGVMNAAAQYVANTPQYEHHLVRRIRQIEYHDDGQSSGYKSVHELSASHLRAIADVRRAVADVQPDVVHAHSSFAGAYMRLAVRNRAGRRLIYTPHCFVFERTDRSMLYRGIFAFAEATLLLNTDTVAACSAREAALTRKMNRAVTVKIVPNVAAEPDRLGPILKPEPRPLVITAGRFSAQKGINFFISTIKATRLSRPDVRAVWVGGGEGADADRLRDAGIEVTGWVTRAGVAEHYRSADIYIQTSAWEGFPLAILEAHSFGLPVAARRIAAIADAPASATSNTPADLGALVSELLQDDSAKIRNLATWSEYLSENTHSAQQRALSSIYR